MEKLLSSHLQGVTQTLSRCVSYVLGDRASANKGGCAFHGAQPVRYRQLYVYCVSRDFWGLGFCEFPFLKGSGGKV